MTENDRKARKAQIYAIDFDGTIAKTKWPEIIGPNPEVVDFIKRLQVRGDQWILWTNRDGEMLENAILWCRNQGLYPDAVNDNLPQMKEFFGRNPRKVFANFYIDDHNSEGLVLPKDESEAPEAGMEGDASQKIKLVDFGQALKAVKRGKKIARINWNGKGQYITLGYSFEYKDANGLQHAEHMTSGSKALVFHGTIGTQVGWLASQSDMLSEDWIVMD